MNVYLENDMKNSKTIFLLFLCDVLGIEKNGSKIIYVDKNNESLLLPFISPINKDINIKPIYSDELKIAETLTKIFLPEFIAEQYNDNNKFVEHIINDLKYNTKKFLEELNEHLKNIFFEEKYIITIFDFFCYSLLISTSNENYSKIKLKYSYIIKWKEYIERKYEMRLKKLNILKYDNNNKEKVNELKEFKNSNINNPKVKKIFIRCIKNKNNPGMFVDFNERKIKAEFKTYNFNDGDIYYFIGNTENGNENITINEKTNLIKYCFNINDFKDFNTDEKMPCYIYGKIFEKNEEYIIIVSSILKKVIFIEEIERFKNIKENGFYYFSFLKIKKQGKDKIYLKTTKFTEIKNDYENKDEINKINEKILIKLNPIKYIKDGNVIYDKIKFYEGKNEILEKTIDNNIIYFIYEEYDYSQEYFPQKIQLYHSKGIISPIFTIFISKGYCNELNISLNNKNGFAYEYYYYANKNINLPKTIKITLNDGKEYTFDNFWEYETKERKKITFVNIPLQEGLKLEDMKSYLKIFTCTNIKKIKEYGTFLLDKLEIEKKKEIVINIPFNNLIKNIVNDVNSFLNEGSIPNINALKSKYLGDNINKYINELKNDYRNYYFPENNELFYFYNRVCIWNILARVNYNEWNYLLNKYLTIYDIILHKNYNISDKIYLLITIVRGALEEEKKIFPKIIFFDELEEESNSYTKAYYFHLKLIDSLNYNSILIKPFLQLDSYIMEKILTEEEENRIKELKIIVAKNSADDENTKSEHINKIQKEKLRTKSAYTISMSSIDTIKRHLKTTMKPYALIYGLNSGRHYLAVVKKDNNIITFNEEEIFKGICSYELYESFTNENKNNFAFIINMLFLHENSSHNKEKVINTKVDSPVIFLDENFDVSFNIIDYNVNAGEAGHFTERFIGDRSIIFGLLNYSNKLGDLLDVNYFNKENFKELIEEYNFRKEKDNNNNDEIITEYEAFRDEYVIRKKKRIKEKNPRFADVDSSGFNEFDRKLFRLSRLKNEDY